MKLEVGMYVRSKINGLISKITDIEEFEELGQIVKRYILDNNHDRGFCSTEKDSVKASHNIIDLIEVGDYVNGYKVSFKDNDYKPFVQCDYPVQEGTTNHYRFYEEAIYSIVTKEQFENMEYSLEG